MQPIPREKIALSTGFAMACKAISKKHQAWQTVLLHFKTEFLTFMQEMLESATYWWYLLNKVDDGWTHADLYEPEFYYTHLNWREWYSDVMHWATMQKWALDARWLEWYRLCKITRLVFHDMENKEDEVFGDTFREVMLYLHAFQHGFNAAFPSWDAVQNVMRATFREERKVGFVNYIER